MKIQSSTVNMFAKTSDSEKTSMKRTLLRPALNQMKPISSDIQRQFKEQLKTLKQNHYALTSAEINPTSDVTQGWSLSEADLQKIALLEQLLSKLTGKEVKFIVPAQIKTKDASYNGEINQTVNSAPPPPLIYKEEFCYQKKSSFVFQSSGIVKTADGREIEFGLSIKASREINFTRTTTVVEKQMQDPLVISFDGNLPQLTDAKYGFDLDFDGRKDQISFLTKGSGFLAFDRNNDGVINDGRELFGPQSGSGFRDLEAYDLDKNGWIDENDPIFEGLRIWTKDENNKDQIFALGEKGIGAIFLGSVASHFDILGSSYAKEGAVRESGVYLRENGSVGGVHHVDIKM